MTVLLVGDDWAADHHDVELMDQAGRVLARARLSEGAAGMARLHALIGEHAGAGDGDDELEVRVGIETDHGPWVMALVASGYVVFAVNPLQASMTSCSRPARCGTPGQPPSKTMGGRRRRQAGRRQWWP